MDPSWIDAVPVWISGAVPGFLGGWLAKYLLVRWVEKRHEDEALERAGKAVDLSRRLFDLHEKACDRNVNIILPLGRRVVELLPITDEQLAEDEREGLNLVMVGQYWLITMLWHCMDLHFVHGDGISLDEAIRHSHERFIDAYNELDAHAVMHDFGDQQTTQLLHCFYGYLTTGGDAEEDAFFHALEQWVSDKGGESMSDGASAQ